MGWVKRQASLDGIYVNEPSSGRQLHSRGLHATQLDSTRHVARCLWLLRVAQSAPDARPPPIPGLARYSMGSGCDRDRLEPTRTYGHCRRRRQRKSWASGAPQALSEQQRQREPSCKLARWHAAADSHGLLLLCYRMKLQCVHRRRRITHIHCVQRMPCVWPRNAEKADAHDGGWASLLGPM